MIVSFFRNRVSLHSRTGLGLAIRLPRLLRAAALTFWSRTGPARPGERSPVGQVVSASTKDGGHGISTRLGKNASRVSRPLHTRVSREGGSSSRAVPSPLPAEVTSTRETLLFPCCGADDDVGELCSRAVAVRG